MANAKIVQYWKLLSVNLERTNLASCILAKQSLGVVFSGKTIASVTEIVKYHIKQRGKVSIITKFQLQESVT